PAPNPQAAEISELKSAILRLQDRVNQLSGTADVKPVQSLVNPPAPVAGPQVGFGPPPPDPQPQPRGFPLQASWDGGLRLESDDKQFDIHIGGVGQVDTVFLIGPHSVFNAPGDGTSGVGNDQAWLLRRAILEANGTIFGQFDYFLQFDFANASN